MIINGYVRSNATSIPLRMRALAPYQLTFGGAMTECAKWDVRAPVDLDGCADKSRWAILISERRLGHHQSARLMLAAGHVVLLAKDENPA